MKLKETIKEYKDLFPDKHYIFMTKDNVNYVSVDCMIMFINEAKKEVFDDIEKEISKITYEPKSDWDNFCVQFNKIKEKN